MRAAIYLVITYIAAGSQNPSVTITPTPDMETCRQLGERVKDFQVHDWETQKLVRIKGGFTCVDPLAAPPTPPPGLILAPLKPR